MPRQPRIEYPGAIYHVMSRGDRREPIFLDDVDRQDFLKTLAEACQKTGFQVHAYCLMNNHYHLVVETPQGNLVAGMRWLQSAYTIRLNHRHQLFGHVFSGRYKALVVEGRGGYLRAVCDYVHLNPVRAELIAPQARLLEYPWSSFGSYLAAREYRPAWLRVDRLLGEHGIAGDTRRGREQFEERMEARRRPQAGEEEQWKTIRRGWCLGAPEFKKELIERMEGQMGQGHEAQLRRESAQAKARRIVAVELKALGWKDELEHRAKSDPAKLAIAARLRRETTLTIREIAKLLYMGQPESLNSKLHHWRKAHEPA